MLARTITLALCTVALSRATADTLERQLIGTWVAEEHRVPELALYLTFRPDRTLASRYRNGIRLRPSTWRVRGDQLIQHWWDGDVERIDVSRPVISDDRLSFGLHEARSRKRRGTWTERQRHVEAIAYKRCPMPPQASNHAMQRTPTRRSPHISDD
ncbi:MAG: hypothetical protein QOH01_2044 [Verrucomicrobiota bacterium]|jgi:hypothetical protein